jgi:hypothetical protein
MENISTVQNKPKSQTKLILVLASVAVLIIGLIAGLLLVRQNQRVSQKAATPTGTAQIYITPETKIIDVNQTFTANILLNTAGQAISALTIDLSYPYSGDNPPILATDVQINSNFIVNDKWNFPIKTINASSGKVQIKIGGLNSSSQGYTTQGEETVATITFKGQAAGAINATFNSASTKVTNKTTGEDILLVPNSSGSYTVRGVSTDATLTPTPSSTTSAQSTSSPTATAIPAKDTSPTPSPIAAPKSGVSLPTTIGIAAGMLLLVVSMLLVF